MKFKYKKVLASCIGIAIAKSFSLGAYAQQTNTAAIVAAEETAQQASATAIIASEEAAQQAATTATIAAEEAAQQAATTATIAAEEAAQQAATTATIAAEEAAQQAATTAIIAAEEAAQQAATTATIAAEEAAQQAATTATIAAEEAAQQAATTATIAAEEAAQQASSATSIHFGSSETLFTSTHHTEVEIQVGGSINNDGVVTGGTVRTISPGDMITAAELEAVQQITTSGLQSIVLNEHGHATDGHAIVMPGEIGSGIQDIIVPEAVSLSLINFNPASPLTVTGSFNVDGSVYSFHDTANVESVLNFGNLNVGSTGFLTGELPSTSIFSSYFASSGLALNVANNVVNAGTISSPGALSINAGQSISNSGLITGSSINLNSGSGITNSNQILATSGNVSLYSQSGNFTNSGVISAALGNINFASQGASDIAITNANGLLEAGNAINVRDASYSGDGNVEIVGGDLISNELNIYSGHGTANLNVGELTGELNILAHEAHVSASTDMLTIGTVVNTGDPTFYNNAGGMNIGNVTVAEDASFVSFGAINAAGATIQARDNTQGFNINIFAGFTMDNPGGADPNVPGSTATGVLNITGVNGADTPINLTNATISTRAQGAGGGAKNGGNVQIGAVTGNIDLTGSTIDTRGRNGGNSGNVTIGVADGVDGTINVGRVRAGSVAGGAGGRLNVVAGDNVTLIGLPSFAVNGQMSGSITFNALNARPNVINFTQGANTDAARITATSGGTINFSGAGELQAINAITMTSRGGMTQTGAGEMQARNINLNDLNTGAIGTLANPILTNATNFGTAGTGLAVNTAAGNAFIRERGSANLRLSNVNGTYTINTITNGTLRLTQNVASTGAFRATTDGNGTFQINNGVTLSTTNSPINITANDYVGNASGSINAGTNIIRFRPNNSNPVVHLGGQGGGTVFRVNNTEFGNMTAADIFFGSLGTPIATNVVHTNDITIPANLRVFTNGTFTNDASNNDIILNNATNNNLTIRAAGNIVTDRILGQGGGANGSVISLTSTGGTVSFDRNITVAETGTARILVNANGNITRNGGTLTGEFISLTSNNGNIGTNANRIRIDANRLTARAPNGNVFLRENDGVQLINNSVANGQWRLLSLAGNITDAGGATAITANQVRLQANAGSIGGGVGSPVNINANVGQFRANQDSRVRNIGDIELLGTHRATNGIYLLTSDGGSITDNNQDATITANTVRLRTVGPGGGSIGTGANRIFTDTDNLAIVMIGAPGGPFANRNAFIVERDSVNVLQSNAVNTFNLIAGDDLARGGNITIAAGGGLNARTVRLRAFEGPLFAGDVTINAPINQTVPTGISPGIIILSDNNIVVNSPITAQRFITLRTTPRGNDIDINARVETTALIGPTLITLRADDDVDFLSNAGIVTGQILNPLSVVVINADDNIRGPGNVGLVRAFTVDLFTRDDDIGVNAGDRLNTNAVLMRVRSGGSAFLREIGAVNINLPSTAVGTFDVLSVNGPVLPFNFTATGTITASDIVLNATDNFAILDILGNLTATNGNITITSANIASIGPLLLPIFNPTLTATGNITVTAPTVRVGTIGNISMNAGAAAPGGTNGSIFINSTGRGGLTVGDNNTFTSNGGSLVGGVQGAGHIGFSNTAGAMTIGSGNTLTATGGNIWFSSAGNIIFGPGNNSTSTFVLNPNGGQQAGTGGFVPEHVGGKIGIGADGTIPVNAAAFLDALSFQRPFVSFAGLPASNTVNLGGQPYFNATGPLGGLAGNTFNNTNGVIFVDPPFSTTSTFTVLGPALIPFPPTPPGPPIPGGGGTGGFVFPFDAATLAALNSQTRLIEAIQSKIAIDQTRRLEGAVRKKVKFLSPKPTKYIKASRTSNSQFTKDELTRLRQEGISIADNVQTGVLHLKKGNVLVNPNNDIVVKHPDGTTYVPKGAMVLFLETGADIAILDLHQGSTKGVKVVSENKLMTLSPGKMLVLSRQNESDLENLNHECKIIGHRRSAHKKLSDNLHAFKTSFSIPSAMRKVIPLKKMLSSNNSQDKKIVRNLLMNAILLKETEVYQGPFMQTAMINK